MIGSVFYSREEANYSRAEEWVAKQREMSDLTGLPAMVDLVMTKRKYVKPHIDFISKLDRITRDATTESSC